jgi:biopolymer transport protein ExbB
MNNQMHEFSILFLLKEGGIPTLLIIISGVALVVLGLERIYTLFLRYRVSSDKMIEVLRTQILARNYNDAIQACNSESSSPDLNVVKYALQAAENGREAMKSALGGALLEVNHKCEARLSYLALIANIATLLGLLGTISGLIKTFASMANADPSQKAQLLGLGISEAMYATATGLAVGIAAMVVHTVCTNKADAIVGHSQDLGFKVITWVEQSERTTSVQSAKNG